MADQGVTMRDLFPGYFQLSDEEIADICKKSVTPGEAPASV
jgi:hypothetical protein